MLAQMHTPKLQPRGTELRQAAPRTGFQVQNSRIVSNVKSERQPVLVFRMLSTPRIATSIRGDRCYILLES